jgi:hypothetical protein
MLIAQRVATESELAPNGEAQHHRAAAIEALQGTPCANSDAVAEGTSNAILRQNDM